MKEPGEYLCEIKNVILGLDIEFSDKISFRYTERVFKAMPQYIPIKQISDFYYDMFIADTLVGNTNRNNSDWGILQSSDDARISPVYGCGSALAPTLTEEDLSVSRGVSCARIANSVVYCSGEDRDGRIVYYDFFREQPNFGIQDALRRVVPRIDLDIINEIITTAEYLSDRRKEFYLSFINTSYKEILLPAFERLL